MSVEYELEELVFTMKNVPVDMRIFSLSMRSLYAEKALGGSSDETRKINKIRDDTREDALVYVKGILPVSTELVRVLKEFFEYYEELDFKEWKENLPDIVEEVRGYRQCCVEIINLHEQIMTPLKKRQNEAKVLIAELKNLTKELQIKKAEFEKSALKKRTWAAFLILVPAVNVIATPLLKMSADSDLAQSVADGAQCIINNTAIVMVSETMIPALSAFIRGLRNITSFFKAVEEEVTTFHNKGEKALENSKKLHYRMMKKKAEDIKESCTQFFAMIPSVRTDILCIPQSGSDTNYVDKWLKKQKEKIQKKYEKSLTGQLRKMLTYFSTDEMENLIFKGEKTVHRSDVRSRGENRQIRQRSLQQERGDVALSASAVWEKKQISSSPKEKSSGETVAFSHVLLHAVGVVVVVFFVVVVGSYVIELD